MPPMVCIKVLCLCMLLGSTQSWSNVLLHILSRFYSHPILAVLPTPLQAQRIQRRIQEEAALGPSTGPDQPRSSLAPLVPVAPAARAGALLPGAPVPGAAGSTLLRPAAGSLPGGQAGRSGAGLLGVSRAPAAAGGGLAGFLPQQQQQQGAQGRAPGPGLSSLGGMLQPGSLSSAVAAGPQAVAATAAGQLPSLAGQRAASQAAGGPGIEVDAEFRPGAPRVGLPAPGYSLMPQVRRLSCSHQGQDASLDIPWSHAV
jgi:hypothetical protein